jgi:UDP-N-acetylbacillosamine N-acetyltransferase
MLEVSCVASIRFIPMPGNNISCVIFGAGGHARVVADIARCGDRYKIIGFLDDMNPERWGAPFAGAKVLGGREQLPGLFRAGVRHAVVGIGDSDARRKLSAEMRRFGFELPTLVHPDATVALDTKIAAGTVVMARAVVNAGTAIGQNVIINTSATVDHDCVIEDEAHIGPGAHLGGVVYVELGAWIGIGAVVRDRIRVGAGSIIGAGAVVLRDIPPGVVAYGVPARVVRNVETRDHERTD